MSMKTNIVTVTVFVTFLVTSHGSSVSCPWCNVELENKVGQIEAKVQTMEQRSSAITGAFMGELNTLQKDFNAIHTVVKRLDTDLGKQKESVNHIQGLGQELVSLRRRVTDVQKHVSENMGTLETKMADISNNYENEKNAQASVTDLLDSQVKENKDILGNIQSQMTKHEKRLSSLKDKMDGLQDSMQSGSGGSTQVVDELRQSLNTLSKEQERKITALRNTITEMQRATAMEKFYPIMARG